MTPDDLYYSKEHEWLRLEGDGSATIGITDHAQQELGDIVYVELPDPGSALEADDVMGSVESVKAVSEIFSPVAGTVTAVNDALEDAPEVVNSDPYGDGWLIRLTVGRCGVAGGDDALGRATTTSTSRARPTEGGQGERPPFRCAARAVRAVGVTTCAARSAARAGLETGVPGRRAIPPVRVTRVCAATPHRSP